jgi:ribosomal protein L29
MKTKEKKTVSAMNKEELDRVLADARNALAILRIGRYSKHSKNGREAKLLRNKIAIVSTLMRQKELVHE